MPQTTSPHHVEYRVGGQLIGYQDDGVVTYKPDDDREAGQRLRHVTACMKQLGAFRSGFLVTLDGELPNLIWGASEALADRGEVECLQRLRFQIRCLVPVFPPGTVLLYRGLALRLFGSDHPGSIITTAPAR
jgi:hypothetical protein